MNLFGRGRRGPRSSAPSGDTARTGSTRVRGLEHDDEAHLDDFIATREGVEGFVEPRTAVSDVTLLLVAWDGEFTRRRVPSADWAYEFCTAPRHPGVRGRRGRHPAADARVHQPAEATEAPLSPRA